MSSKSDGKESSNKSTDILNLGSVIVGVLVFLTASAWIDFFRALSDEVYLNEYDDRWLYRYGRTWRAFLIAIINLIVLVITIIIIYSWYQRNHPTIICSSR